MISILSVRSLGLLPKIPSPNFQYTSSEAMSFQNRISCVVVVLGFTLFLSLVAMAVQRAQVAAMKMSSGNSLKQIGLGLHNFESSFKRLPEGCDIEAKHGWMTRIHPFMEASSWYNRIYLNQSWDHPSNDYKFYTRMSFWERPNVAELHSEEGYGLAHYLANPAVLHRNSKLRFSQVEVGLSNTWFAGEVSGKYRPFGYPFNWRVLSWPLNDGLGGYGGWSDGAQFCMGDGSIRFVSASIDKSVIEQLAIAIPMPDGASMDVPNRDFKFIANPKARSRKHLFFPNEETHPSKGSTCSEIIFDLDGMPQIAVFEVPRIQNTKVGIRIETILERYPEIKVLDYRELLDDNAAETIAKFRELETLIAGRFALTDSGIRNLSTLSRLKSISCIQESEEGVERLSAALPHCEIDFRQQ
jgi:hypothetical protein